MLAFMRDFATRFQLNVTELRTGFKEGLSALVNGSGSRTGTPLKAMFTGTRRDDPNGRNQTVFCPTDASWPPLMRVNPILDLGYHDIWTLIRVYNLPYCAMYDRGFTSIGTTDDTTPNESLWSHLTRSYLPPWRLERVESERLGRGCRKFLSNPSHPHLLAYPIDVLQHITSYLQLRDLYCLYMAGCMSLNFTMHHGGVESVYFIEQHHQHISLSLPFLTSAFSSIHTLDLDFSISDETTCASSSSSSSSASHISKPIDFSLLPQSLRHLVLRNPRSGSSLSDSAISPSDTSAHLHIPSPSTPSVLATQQQRQHTESDAMDAANLVPITDYIPSEDPSSPENRESHLSAMLKDGGDAPILLPKLETLLIDHHASVEPISLKRIQCPELKSLLVRPFPLDLNWLETLKKLETLEFYFRSSESPLPLPQTLKSLTLHRMFVQDLTPLENMPQGLTSLRLSAAKDSIIRALVRLLPASLTSLHLTALEISTWEPFTALPESLRALFIITNHLHGDATSGLPTPSPMNEEEGNVANDPENGRTNELAANGASNFEFDGSSSPSPFGQWIASLPSSLEHLYLDLVPPLRTITGDVHWPAGLKQLDTSLILSTSQIASLPRTMHSLRVRLAHVTDDLEAAQAELVIAALPKSLTNLAVSGVSLGMIDQWPEGLNIVSLTCSKATSPHLHPKEIDSCANLESPVAKLPNSLTALRLHSSTIGDGLNPRSTVHMLPYSLHSLCLDMEERLKEHVFELLPRQLVHINIRVRNVETYGEGLKKLPPKLAHLAIIPALLSVDPMVAIREYLPTTLSRVALGPIRIDTLAHFPSEATTQ